MVGPELLLTLNTTINQMISFKICTHTYRYHDMHSLPHSRLVQKLKLPPLRISSGLILNPRRVMLRRPASLKHPPASQWAIQPDWVHHHNCWSNICREHKSMGGKHWSPDKTSYPWRTSQHHHSTATPAAATNCSPSFCHEHTNWGGAWKWLWR